MACKQCRKAVEDKRRLRNDSTISHTSPGVREGWGTPNWGRREIEMGFPIWGRQVSLAEYKLVTEAGNVSSTPTLVRVAPCVPPAVSDSILLCCLYTNSNPQLSS
ncbi:hypothetical protein J6590_006004 [Homalodisca vitripennis]|nr:hypothetical protein J6590_006004 [Homalodisca vitripennis]